MSIAATATDDERATLAAILRSIEAADLPAELTLTPAVCAGLFLRLHRGTWNADRVHDLAQTMRAGAWHVSHQGSIGFGQDSVVDGHHRLAAAALAGYTLKVPVVYCSRETMSAIFAKLAA
jgi:hypothetical protein